MMTVLNNGLPAAMVEGVQAGAGDDKARMRPQQGKAQADFKSHLERKNITVAMPAAEPEEGGEKPQRQKKRTDAISAALLFSDGGFVAAKETAKPPQPSLPAQTQVRLDKRLLSEPSDVQTESQQPPAENADQPLDKEDLSFAAAMQRVMPVAEVGKRAADVSAPDTGTDIAAVEPELPEDKTPPEKGKMREPAMAKTSGHAPAGSGSDQQKNAMVQPAPVGVARNHENKSHETIKTDAPETARTDRPETPVMKLMADDLAQDTGVSHAKIIKPLEIGDKIAFKAEGNGPLPESRIQAVEVTRNHMAGDVRVLHLRLTPQNLGVVEARIRVVADGLHIDLRAAHEGTSRLLATDQAMLASALEKSGFKDQGHVSVTVRTHSDNAVHAGSAMAQTGGDAPADQGWRSDQQGFGRGGQDARSDAQTSGQNNGRGGRQPSDEARRSSPYSQQQSDEQNRESHAYRYPRGLIV